MQKQFETIKKIVTSMKSKKQQQEYVDEDYRQINSISFQENFKNLIGHYKQAQSTVSQQLILKRQ
jgi:hypothetical protein